MDVHYIAHIWTDAPSATPPATLVRSAVADTAIFRWVTVFFYVCRRHHGLHRLLCNIRQHYNISVQEIDPQTVKTIKCRIWCFSANPWTASRYPATGKTTCRFLYIMSELIHSIWCCCKVALLRCICYPTECLSIYDVCDRTVSKECYWIFSLFPTEYLSLSTPTT